MARSGRTQNGRNERYGIVLRGVDELVLLVKRPAEEGERERPTATPSNASMHAGPRTIHITLPLCAEGHADADLLRALRGDERKTP